MSVHLWSKLCDFTFLEPIAVVAALIFHLKNGGVGWLKWGRVAQHVYRDEALDNIPFFAALFITPFA